MFLIPSTVKCLIEYGFNELELDLIWCGHFDYNTNSRRVNEKCGFKYRFKVDEIMEALNKDVIIWYYCIFKSDYELGKR